MIGCASKEIRDEPAKQYDAAVKIVWEEQCKHAIRPDDPYHRLLLEKINPHREIELTELPEKTEEPVEQHENTVIKILPGTPRRRRRSAFI